MVAAIVADPGDEAAWMVYADWLLERNHPRGELIQLGPLAASGDRAAAWRIRALEADEDVFLSPRLLERAAQWRFAFERGFLRLAEFHHHARQSVDAEAIGALCADAHAGLLATLVLQIFEYTRNYDPVTGTDLPQYLRTDVGDLGAELGRLRRLDRLVVHGVACDALVHRNLRQLKTDSLTCRGARIDLPALEVLEWAARSEQDAWGAVLDVPLPRLRSVSIGRGYESMIAPLAASPIAGRLQRFAIVTDDVTTIETLARHSGAFANLSELDVRGIHEDLEQIEVDRLRQGLERVFPRCSIGIRWSDLLPDPPEVVPARDLDAVEVDEQSRRPDGTIDAMAKFNRGR